MPLCQLIDSGLRTGLNSLRQTKSDIPKAAAPHPQPHTDLKPAGDTVAEEARLVRASQWRKRP